MRRAIKRTGLIVVVTFVFVLAGAVPLSPRQVAASDSAVPDSAPLAPSLEGEDRAMGLPCSPLEWCIRETPGSVGGSNDILNPFGLGSEIVAMDVGNDGATAIAAVRRTPNAANGETDNIHLMTTNTNGISWTTGAGDHLIAQARAAFAAYWALPFDVWDVAIAPDDPNFWAVVTTGYDTVAGAPVAAPLEVWVTENAGAQWTRTQFWEAYEANNPGPASWNDGFISAIDISPDYGGRRDIAVGVRNAGAARNANLEIWVLQTADFAGWTLQNAVLPIEAAVACDLQDLEFSPTYAADAALAVVFTDPSATYFNVALRDTSPAANNIVAWVYNPSIEVKDPMSACGVSPGTGTIVSADLEVPINFNGQSASQRRAYISIDAGAAKAIMTDEDGIYRVDDNVVYELMDTSTVANKRIRSIAYYGTYASGKLLVGEVLGFPCTATVPTWFTDSPTTCPIPCWYPALKPTTGAACGAGGACAIGNQTGVGAALVEWNADGSLAQVGTGCHPIQAGGAVWWQLLDNAPCPNDESAHAISRNNGETWNQLGLIDTTIAKLTDVAPSADCNTLYLASANSDGTACCTFDSVWRTSSNNAVTSPLPAYPIGSYYERVYCRVTNLNCTLVQSDHAILRLAPDKTDGQIIAWAAQGTQAQAWSPDFGDFWAIITPRNAIQDFAFESSTILYDLDPGGIVQKLPYTGTAWSTAEPNVDTSLGSGHTIAALTGGHVLVGAAASSVYPVSYSPNSAASFTVIPEQVAVSAGNVHVAFDDQFLTTGIIYAATENAADPGAIYRNTVPSYAQWTELKPLAIGYHGLAISTQGTLYAANPLFVERTLHPETGVPGDEGEWDVLMCGLAGFPCRFTLQPGSLKLCGCLTPDTSTKLWAIDDNAYLSPTANDGRLWMYEDCLAKAGPTLTTQDGMLVGCDPFSGRARQIGLSWDRLCRERFYEVQLADDVGFTQGIWRHLWYRPPISSSPTFVVPPGGISSTSVDAPSWVDTLAGTVFGILGVSADMDVIGLEPTMSVADLRPECGHTYYWRIRATGSVDDDLIRSPWSEARSFTVRAGGAGAADEIGVWRPSNFRFYLDYNGNGSWDAGVDKAFPWGNSTCTPLVGDWNNDGKDKIGVWYPTNHRFYLDHDGSGTWNAGDKAIPWGNSSCTPVVGDWNGDGKDKVGVWYPSTSRFYLDYDGSGTWNAGDKAFKWGNSSCTPVVGDWNNDGKDKIGVWHPSNHTFYLDYDGSGTWNAGDKAYMWGNSSCTPVVGDWNNDGKDKIGVWYPTNFRFYLDYDGSGTWNAGDKAFKWGDSSCTPLVGNWNGGAGDKIGVWHPSSFRFYLDYDGSGTWNAGDKAYRWGDSSCTPLVGNWD